MQATHLGLSEIWFLWQPTLFQSLPILFRIFRGFQLEKHFTRPQTRPNIFMCLLDHANAYSPQQSLKYQGVLEASMLPCRMLIWLRTYIRIFLQRIKQLALISFFIIFDQNSVEIMTSSLGQFAYFKNSNISLTKTDIWKSLTAFFLFVFQNSLHGKNANFIMVALQVVLFFYQVSNGKISKSFYLHDRL